MIFIKFIFAIELSNLILFVATSDTDHDTLEAKYGKIIHVSVVFRHGDRTPFSTYPLDPHKYYPWENGIGQLTNEGKNHLFSVGKWFRKHYSKLLQTVRYHNDLRIDSSGIDRTIMSAQCLMAGFYPPNQTEVLRKGLNWQSVPVHVTPKNNNMINIFLNCPAIPYYSRKFFEKNRMKKNYDKFKDEFSYLEKHTGLKYDRNDIYKAIINVYILHDTLSIEIKHNLTLPKWTKKVYPEVLEKLLKTFSYKEMKVLKIQRIMTGRIFKSIAADMTGKAKNINSTNTFHFYSGHDVTLAAILNALDLYDGFNPPLGASLSIEVRRRMNESFLVTIRYMKSVKDGLRLLQIPKCKTPCPLRRLLKILNSKIPKNIEAECHVSGKKKSDKI